MFRRFVPVQSKRVPRYDTPTIVLHWLTAGLVVALWIIGETVDFPSGTWRIDYRSVHIVLGFVLAFILIARLDWRIRRGLTMPPDRHRLRAVAAKAMHGVLYLLLFATVAVGMTYEFARGDRLFNLFQMPSFAHGNRALIHWIGGYHALAANTVLILAGLHAAVALFHHYIMRDDILVRMAPVFRRFRQPGRAEAT